jgi:uncharacterized membrane protein
MFSFYLLLKFLHISSAIVAVGSNITYAVWNARAQADPSQFGFAVKGIKFLDDRIANPAYGMLLLTGLVMIAAGHLAISFWIVAALVLFAVVVVLGVGFFSPLLRAQIRLADAGDTSSPEFERLARRNRTIGPILGLVVVVILVLMVFKPTL